MELITFSHSVNETALAAKAAGQTIEISEAFSYVSIENKNSQEAYYFQDEDAVNLINEAKESAVYNEGYCTLEDIILFLAQGW